VLYNHLGHNLFILDEVQMDQYAAQVRAFFESRLPRRSGDGRERTSGADEIAVLDDQSREQEAVQLTRAREWCTELFDADYAWIDGPTEFGGAGLTAEHREVFRSIEREYALPRLDTLIPSRRAVALGLAAIAPLELARTLVPPLLRADIIACQLFSEPGAGSDLAAIGTRAAREGQGWRVNGQKVWSSGAHYSDIGMLIARTSSEGAPQAGLTAFLIDMRQPSVTIRPLEQMCGGANFNEVFIDDLLVDDRFRLGEVGDGWKVAMATLAGERQSVAKNEDSPTMAVVERLLDLSRTHLDHSARSDVLRDRVVATFVRARCAELLNERLDEESRRSGRALPVASMGKLCRSSVLRAATAAAGDILGAAMVADTGEWGTYAWGRATLQAPGVPIGGGTDEIQRNIVAERVLGLPRDNRPTANV
jgi:alkylation response protein AidB-like acyl-CoA dehydrogenase